eukprot:scaffold172452_cov46-Prasinocladus_malaysianus.AAC.1
MSEPADSQQQEADESREEVVTEDDEEQKARDAVATENEVRGRNQHLTILHWCTVCTAKKLSSAYVQLIVAPVIP